MPQASNVQTSPPDWRRISEPDGSDVELNSKGSTQGVDSPASLRAAERFWSQGINSGSKNILDAMANIGAWWKGTKQTGSQELGISSATTSVATTPDSAYSSYLLGVGWRIARADAISFDEGMRPVPKMLDQRSMFSKGMSKLGAFVDATTGALDVMAALHDEGGKPGRKTMRHTAKTLAQVTLGGAAGSAIFAGVGALGVGIAGAPLVLGAVATVGVGYGIGRALDWWAGEF